MTSPKAPPIVPTPVLTVAADTTAPSANEASTAAASRNSVGTGPFNWKLTTRNRAHHICRALLDREPSELSTIVKVGVPGDALVWMSKATGLSFVRTTAYLGISRATAKRKIGNVDEQRFGPADSDAVVAFGRLIGLSQLDAGRSTAQLEEGPKRLGRWLQVRQPELGSEPASFLHFGMGRAEVVIRLKADISRGRF